ncbi:MAG: hypothetical protein AVDCRST_MAG08-47, partial [uncultured Acetobacteraceae bacterium]
PAAPGRAGAGPGRRAGHGGGRRDAARMGRHGPQAGAEPSGL